MKIDSSILEVKGIGEKTAKSLEKLEIYTVHDLMLYFPRDYVKYPPCIRFPEEELKEGRQAILCMISKSPVVKKTSRMQVTILSVGENEKKMEVVWYRMPYIKNLLIPGKQMVFYGSLLWKNQHWVMEHPAIYSLEEYEKIEEQYMPVYGLTSGITNNLIMKTMRSVFKEELLFEDYLPGWIKKQESLCEYNYALNEIHFPDSMEALIDARKRLVFDEFFLFILGMQYQKERQQKEKNSYTFTDRNFVKELIHKLPYELTQAQLRTIEELQTDMESPYVMQRLIQGDVGSGKTIVAFLLMAWCAVSGYQSAIMAPTEVLARQHYESFMNLCQSFSLEIPIILLTGSLTASQKKKVYKELQEKPNAMIIGTHALIQEKAVYGNMALVITDEQHRFGVKQRDTFSEKGASPHIVVMSATPIPRTLAIILYGDMDISVIDQVPAKRLPIKNCVVSKAYRPKAYDFIKKQVEMGHQAYVICPLVEESESLESENVSDYAKALQEELPENIKIGILHGKMKNADKNQVMEDFAKNQIQVLVSTTVVEVGVNVPNATTIMIENADRFGLAQLHQLRGRVGRGDAQSYCIMINTSDSKNSKKRLEILNHSNDGFYIASEDLKLRGPGDFFGIRQSGDMSFQLADIYQDADVMRRASGIVNSILEQDPALEKEENQGLKRLMNQFIEVQMKKMNL